MKKHKLLITSILFLSILIPVLAFPQSSNKDDEMQEMMSYMTPGPQHEMLAKMSGDWTYDMSMWMEPNSSPVTSSGTAKFEMILGGRYQMSNINGSFMNMPFNGINLVGYDNGKMKYFTSWIDNMGTGIMYAEGTYDEMSKSLNFTGKFYDPMQKKDVDYRQVIKNNDDNSFTMTMYETKDGKEFKCLECIYKKK